MILKENKQKVEVNNDEDDIWTARRREIAYGPCSSIKRVISVE